MSTQVTDHELELSQLLRRGFNPATVRLNRHALAHLDAAYRRWRKRQRHDALARLQTVPRKFRAKARQEDPELNDRRGARHADLRHLFDFVSHALAERLEWLQVSHRQHVEFRQNYALALSVAERRQILLNYARQLGASWWQLRSDARAMDRWLDEDALTERFERRRGEAYQTIEFYLGRLGEWTALMGQLLSGPQELPGLFRRLGLEGVLAELLVRDVDVRLQTAAVKMLEVAIQAWPIDACQGLIGETVIAKLEKRIRNGQTDAWLAAHALALLGKCAPQKQLPLMLFVMQQPPTGDAMFLRGRVVALALQQLALQELGDDADRLREVVEMALHDAAPWVRQALARHLGSDSNPWRQACRRQLARLDKVPAVRAMAVAAELVDGTPVPHVVSRLRLCEEMLADEQDPFVLRAAFATMIQVAEQVVSAGEPPESTSLQILRNSLLPALRQLQHVAPDIPTRRLAARAAEQIWARCDQCAYQVLTLARTRRDQTPLQKTFCLPGHIPEPLLGRVLAVMAQDDVGYEVFRGWRQWQITRGTPLRFRLWRWLFELRHAATDKRQAFCHTVGRDSESEFRVPSEIMAELSETKVPGEPLHLAEEGGWRPYLPLPDDLLSALQLRLWTTPAVRFFTSVGITTLMPPVSLVQRLVTWLRLTWNFPRIAQLRNWTPQRQTPAGGYVQAIRQHGYQLQLEPYHDVRQLPYPVDRSLGQFWAGLLALSTPRMWIPVRNAIQDFASYFGSIYENSLTHLLTYGTTLLGLFLGRHFYANWSLRTARNKIALSIGGWGTRGKSGTERLKGALLNGLGYGLVSKSTGCEAMFLVGQPYGRLTELPLFRPFDKATIWEHRNVVRMAAQISPTVFLWECMGLTPAYVHVLQHQWMRDDLATITNTFPDHEDVQGPAGFNVAEVIAGFCPRRAVLFTTEQHMWPLLANACRQLGTRMQRIHWLHSGLLTEDVLARFPYREHPDNIALVTALAAELQVPSDVAVKYMADHVVLDLGVLKSYPVAQVRGRRLEFTNGMSANERYGCIGNWQRMGYADHDYLRDPNTWITSVVNNRADRVPRSRVFARMLVFELSADRHFLIGGNLKGLVGFVEEAWQEFTASFDLWPDEQSSNSVAASRFEQQTRRLRQVMDLAQVARAISESLRGLAKMAPEDELLGTLAEQQWHDADALQQALEDTLLPDDITERLKRHFQSLFDSCLEYSAMRRQILECHTEHRATCQQACHALLWSWFRAKLVIVEDYYASGDEVIGTIVEETPPGYFNRVMGLQNIKGTGLDFVYRWQAWNDCFAACERARSSQPTVVASGLRELAKMPTFGLLSAQAVREVVQHVQRSGLALREGISAELNTLKSRLEETAGPQRSQAEVVDSRWAYGLGLVEQSLDNTDSVRRRKKADQIYDDLVHQRISMPRAVNELRAVNMRQKGGWVLKAWKDQWAPRSAVASRSEAHRGWQVAWRERLARWIDLLPRRARDPSLPARSRPLDASTEHASNDVALDPLPTPAREAIADPIDGR